MQLLQNKLVVISGGAGKLGHALANFFGAQGSRLLLVDFNKEKLKLVAKDLGQKNYNVRYFPIDITKETHIEHLANDISNSGRQPDLVINAVATNIMLKIDEVEEREWKKMVESVLKGTRNCIKYFSMHMEGGSIVTILPFPEPTTNSSATLYSSLKVGLTSLTAVWARELAIDGTRVNAVLPGFFKEIEDKISKQNINTIIDRIPAGRPGSFIDIAETILFLSSPQSKYINGALIPVDGGYFT